MVAPHTFHIPVMGIGYTIDSPLKVAQYGIDSVISLVDDMLLEKLRKMYSEMYEIPYREITEKMEDFRAKRITSYLNMMHELTQKKFDEFKLATIEKSQEIKDYITHLPDTSEIKKEFLQLTDQYLNLNEIKNWIVQHLSPGSIDVNIMTKVDKDNYRDGEKLPVEFNDAHAALRGFAESDLHSSVILSAGMNPRLYGYIENFDDFYPDEMGSIKKKIVLKVSDYRSALIQGKYLAKKGLWVSEYRIESGLNCGGHAFATDGFLLGPVLAEFRDHRVELAQSVQDVLLKALDAKNRAVPGQPLPLKITAQGGVGTAEEHNFLIKHYQLDSVGWGTPFLLVPEATSVDHDTLNKLIEAREEDLYLSGISPLGVPFNNLKGNTKDEEKNKLIEQDRPGSTCPKRYVAMNVEMTDEGICTASRQYQRLKLKALKESDLSSEEYQKEYDKIVEKSCICVGLGTSILIKNEVETKLEGTGVSICPGPAMAYFSKILSLKEMIDYIYGRSSKSIVREDRPNMFIKELNLYIDYLKNKIEEVRPDFNKKQEKYMRTFTKNLHEGIAYYRSLFEATKGAFDQIKHVILRDLEKSEQQLDLLNKEIEKLPELV